MNRLLFVTLHFPPSRDIGAQACEQIARYLPPHGWAPVILTRPRRYVEMGDPKAPRTFAGEIVEAGLLPHPLSIYRRLKPAARPNSAPAAAAGAGNEQQSRLRRWVLSLLMTPDQYTGWILPATVAGLRAIRRDRITHIISSGPYWTNHIVAMILAKLTGLSWTAHYRDPWNQIPQMKPVSALSSKIERWLERLVIRRASSIACVTDAHTRLLQGLFPALAAEKFVTIPNGFDGAEWAGVEPRAHGDKFTITYAGSFMMGKRTPRPLFAALRRLIDAGVVDIKSLGLRLFGNCDVAEGVPVGDMAAEYGLAGVLSVGGALGRRETLQEMLSADLLLLLAEGWTLQIPGKTYEYLRAGKPILALTTEGALADLLRRTGGAWIADPSADAVIDRALAEAYKAWQSGAQPMQADAGLVENFDRRRLAGQFAALFNEGPAGTRVLTTLYSTN
jgi:glycosyltransferase involved in cell wall biosynthesis